MAFWDWLTKRNQRPNQPIKRQQVRPQQNPKVNAGALFRAVQSGASRAYDQVNPLDNGLSSKTRQINPTVRTRSVVQQATPLAKSVVKAPAQFLNTAATQVPQVDYTLRGVAAQATGNNKALANALRMQQLANQRFNQNKGGLFNAGTFYGADDARRGDLKTGVTKVGGGVLQTAATVAPFAKGGSVAAMASKQNLLRAAPKFAAEGAGYGAAFSTGSQLQDTGKINLKNVGRDAAIGAVGNVAIPVVGRAVKAQAPKVAAGTVKGAQKAQTAATPKPIRDIDQTIKQYQKAFDVETNPTRRKQISQGITQLNAQRRAMAEGGYAKIPNGKNDPAPDLSHEQKTFINDYAEMLKGMGQGNGVNILPDGRRVSNNVRSAADRGKALTNQDWFDRARADIEGGKAAYGASQDFANIPTKPLQVSDIPDAFNVGRPNPPTNAEQRVFAQNPLAVRGSNVQPVSAGDVLATRKNNMPRTAVAGQQPLASPSSTQIGVKGSPLPEFNTKKVSNVDKAFRSTRSIIERQGKSGQELAGKLQGARDTQELYLAQLQKQMPTVAKLARKGKNALVNKDFENFVDATQGQAKPKNATIAQAVQEWQATHPSIRERAVGAGLDVGDLGQNYYPHFIDYERVFKDTNTYNEAINHLVKTGQAESPEAAIQLLSYARDVSRNRQFGNLEASRLVDLPFYDKTPNSLVSYLQGSTKRIASTEAFGAKDEHALELIKKIGLEGGDTEAAKQAFDVAVGAKQYNPNASKISGGIRKYVTTTRLGLGALTNVSQGVNTGIVTGHTRTLLSMAKQLDPKVRRFAEDTGVISDAVLNDIKTQSGFSSFSSKVAGKALNKVTAPGFGAVEKFNRSVAATAGRDYALRLAQKGRQDTLRKLGVTGEIKNGTLTEAQQIQAARKVVEKTQFKVDPQDLPGWADSPGGKLVAQFRTFSYNQGKFFSNEIAKPAAKGNLAPLARLMAALPVGYGLYETRRAIDGRPEEENKGKIALQSFGKIGGAGLAFDLYQSLNPAGSQYIPSDRRVSMAAGAFGGPAIGTAIQGVGALSETVQRKNTPTDADRLQGKIALANSGGNYTDATPAARFALQQVPIVGTPIKNRLLPFKKESQADTGTATVDNKRLTSDQAVKAAFTSDAGKKYLGMNAADRKAAAATDPTMRSLYDNERAIRKAYSTPELHSQGISSESAKVLDHYNRLTDKGKANFDANFAQSYKLKQAQLEDKVKSGVATPDELYNAKKALLDYKIASEPQYLEVYKQIGVPIDRLPKTSKEFDEFKQSPAYKFVLADQQYQLDKNNNKISPIDDYKMQDTLHKMQIQAPFSKDAVEILGMGEKRILDFLNDKGVPDDLKRQLVALDAANVANGIYKNSRLDGASGKGGGKGGKKKTNPSAVIPGAIRLAVKKPGVNVKASKGRQYAFNSIPTGTPKQRKIKATLV